MAEVRTNDSRTVTIGVNDGQVRPVQYTRSGRQYRVDLVILQWRRSDSEPWRLDKAELRGPVLKKDGSDSLNRTDEGFYRDPPAWVADLVAEHQPPVDESRESAVGS